MSTVNRSISGKPRGGVPSTSWKPRVSKLASALGLAASDTSSWWTFQVSGDYAYGTRGHLGIYAIDVSTVNTPVMSDSSLSHDTGGTDSDINTIVRDTSIIGNTLVTISRNNSTAAGRIETWDISTAGTLGSNVGVTTDVHEEPNAKFSACDTDGNHIYVSSQVAGLWKFDVSTITAIVETASITTGNWETQGIAVNSTHIFCANYTYGLRIIDIATFGVTDDVSIARQTIGNAAGRPWECVLGTVHGTEYLFVTTNRDSDTDDRGLQIWDISTPGSMSGSDLIGNCLLPQSNIPTYTASAGDPALLGLSFLNNYIYAANTSGGVVVFDVNDVTRPKYVGTYEIQDSGDQLNGVTVWQSGGNSYLITGDGNQPTDTGTNKIYTGEIL